MLALGIGLAVLLSSRRRALRSYRQAAAVVPLVRPAPPRPVLRVPQPPIVRPVEGNHVRRYVWGVAVLLIVVAAAVFSLSTVADQPPAFVPQSARVVTPAPPGYAPAVQVAEQRPPAKKRDWWKKEKERPPVEPIRAWTIEQHTFPAAPEVNTRGDLLEKIGDRLRGDLSLRNTPSPQFVGNPAWVRIGEVGREIHAERDPKLGEVVTVRYSVELTPQGWQALADEQRVDRASSRMEFAARGVALLTLLLGVVAAYVRLDDWTKGYYSGRLFLAAAALAAVGGTMLVVPW